MRGVGLFALSVVLAGVPALPVRSQESPPYPQKLWSVELKSACYGSGAVGDIDGDGKPEIVFGTYFNDEHVYALNAEDGSVLWKQKSERGPFDASVALADVNGDGTLEAIFSDSSSGHTWCCNGKGETLWKIKLPNSTDSPPAVADLDGDGDVEIVIGTMMLGDRHGRVVALEGKTGATLWTAKTPGHVQSEPVLVDLDAKGSVGHGTLDVIVTNWFGDNAVRALDGADGALRWRHPVADKTYHGVSLLETKAGTRIVAASTKADVFLLDLMGEVVWKKEIGGYLFAPITIANLDGTGADEIICATTRVVVLGANGEQRWATGRLGSSSRGAAVADLDGDGDLDIALGTMKTFRVLDGPTGTELWTFDATAGRYPHERISAPLIADFDGDGKLDVFFVTGKGNSDKTKAQNYGRAYALRAGNGSPKHGNVWTTFRGNLRRTGNAR